MTAPLSPVESGTQSQSDIRSFPSRTLPSRLLQTIGMHNPLPLSPIEHYYGTARDGKLRTKFRTSFRADGIGGNRTAILAKGGLWTNEEIYRPLADEMAALGFVVVWADTAYEGLREDNKRKKENSTEVQIDSFLSVADAARIPGFADKFHFWGHSWGGRIVAGAAAAEPEYAESVIVFETLLACTRGQLLSQTPSYGARNLAPSVMRYAKRGNIKPAWNLATRSARNLGELLRQGWEVSGEHVEPSLETIKSAGVPYAVDAAEDDPFLPADRQSGAMARADDCDVVHGGHNFAVDRPKETAAITAHHIAVMDKLRAAA